MDSVYEIEKSKVSKYVLYEWEVKGDRWNKTKDKFIENIKKGKKENHYGCNYMYNILFLRINTNIS